MSDRVRSYWGWGYEDEQLSPSFLEQAREMVRLALGLPELTPKDPLPRSELALRPPRFSLPAWLRPICTADSAERATHSYGRAFRDVIRGLRGQFDNPPDYVAYPRTEEDVARLLSFCAAEKVALVPYGGGSSVVGGVEPPRATSYRGTITCDLRHLDRILAVDVASRTGRFQAGIYGPALEAGLKPYGLTLRHFPQSFEFSTVGGWIATRAGGHYATLYTHIDDFVQAIRIVTPQGVWQTRPLPGSGAGPDPNRLILGSEGIFGIITEATLRLQAIPVFREKATVRFDSEADALAAVRLLSQSGLFPANCRLISPLEALSTGIGRGREFVLLLGFESHDHPQATRLARALEICAEQRGSWERDEDPDRADADTADRWKSSFLRAPYLRDELVRCGLIMETFETAVTWDRFAPLHRRVLAAANSAMESQCGKGLIMWRFTHVYPDGPAPYYTIVAPGRPGEEIVQWDAIKTAVSDAILAEGGTITHHHAVGKDHRRWYEQQRDPQFGRVLAAAKRAIDPTWVLNPEVLISPE